MPKSARPTKPADHYRIAAVAKFTGMPIPTIRMWERRYDVVVPARSAANGRLYSRQDIDRLSLLKAAVDAGHAIGTIAALTDEQIRIRLRESPAVSINPPSESCRVIVCGKALAQDLRSAWKDRRDIQVVASLDSHVEPPPEALPHDANAVIVEASTLQATAVRQLRQLRQQTRARVVIVVYGFSSRQTLARLDQEGILAIASPTQPAQLARVCHLGLSIQTQADAGIEKQLLQPARQRRYTDEFLGQISRTPATIRCECPHHLADLLSKLNAFEAYSLECENMDTADASIHALLYGAASHCRELLEHALSKVLEHEGVKDPTRNSKE